MGTTTNHNLRYPEDANAVAVPADVKKLADDVDAKLVSSAGGTVSGNISFTGTTVVQTPTANNHAATKLYVDTADSAITTELGTNPSGAFSTVADRLNTQDHPASTTDNTVSRYDGTQGKLQTSTVVIDDNGRLTTVTGATGGYGFVGGAVHLTGTGTPESVITAAPGSTYLQTDSTVDVKGWIRWVKSTGVGNTGWIAGPEADTGWRGLTPLSPSNTTVGWLRVRRVGQVVQVSYRITITDTAWKAVYGVLAGFKPRGAYICGVCPRPGGGGPLDGSQWMMDADVNLSIRADYGSIMDGGFSYLAYDAWPTSLPGSLV